jgi:hypothetical protein
MVRNWDRVQCAGVEGDVHKLTSKCLQFPTNRPVNQCASVVLNLFEQRLLHRWKEART